MIPSYIAYKRRTISWIIEQIAEMIRNNLVMVLLVEGCLFFAMPMTLSTPLAWGADSSRTDDTSSSNSSESKTKSQADTNVLNVSTLLERINGVVTNFLLPVAVAWVSWQLVYLSLVCGLMGIDPLHVVNKQGSLENVDVWREIRNRFVHFAYGLAWIAGVWLIFEASIFLVSNFVGILEARL